MTDTNDSWADGWEHDIDWPPSLSDIGLSDDTSTRALAWSREEDLHTSYGTLTDATLRAPHSYSERVRSRAQRRSRRPFGAASGPLSRSQTRLVAVAGAALAVIAFGLGSCTGTRSPLDTPVAPTVAGPSRPVHPYVPPAVNPNFLAPNIPPSTAGDQGTQSAPPPGSLPPYYPDPMTQDRLRALWSWGIVPSPLNPTGAR